MDPRLADEEDRFASPAPGTPIKWVSQIPAVGAYIQRIGAFPTGMRRAVIGLKGKRYDEDQIIVFFDRDGGVRIADPAGDALAEDDPDLARVQPTADEAKAIKSSVCNAMFPSLRPVPLERLRASMPGWLCAELDAGNIFSATNAAREVEFVQIKHWNEPDSAKKYRSLFPTDHPDDGGWIWGEPEGRLALFNGHLLALDNGRPKVLHEGAMAVAINAAVERARAIEAGLEPSECPMLGKRPSLAGLLDSSPAREFLLSADHIGWPGGAGKPFCADVGPIQTAPGRIIMVADHDAGDEGLEASNVLIRRIGRPVDLVRFNDAFPDRFDMADTYPAKAPRPEALMTLVSPAPDLVTIEARTSNRPPVVAKIYDNVARALRALDVQLTYDVFASREVLWDIRGILPHDDDRRSERRPLSDKDVRAIYLAVNSRFQWNPDHGWFKEAVVTLAQAKRFHPVRDYIDRLLWDGEARVDGFFARYFGAEDSELNREFGARVLIASVRRIRRPGTKFDYTPTLIGPEGGAKSTSIRVMSVRDEWFTDSYDIRDDPKETIEQCRGVWHAELAEMSAVRGKDLAKVKKALSKVQDSARMAYDRLQTYMPRQYMLWGTMNPEEAQILNPGAMNRRFWMIPVGRIDIEALKRDMAQIWAEAAHREAQGETIELPERLWGAAHEATVPYHQDVTFKDTLEAVLPEEGGRVRVEAIRLFLGIHEKDYMPSQKMKQAMDALGWKRTRFRVESKPTYFYAKNYKDGAEDVDLRPATPEPVVEPPAADGGKKIVNLRTPM